MSSDDRCPAVHPELGIRCERMAKHCVGPGIDHTAKRADGTHALWPNEHGTTPMHNYFRLWLQGMQALAEKRNKVEAEREGEDLEDCRATDFLD